MDRGRQHSKKAPRFSCPGAHALHTSRTVSAMAFTPMIVSCHMTQLRYKGILSWANLA